MNFDNSYSKMGIRELRSLYRSQLVKNPNINKFFRGKEELEKALSKFFPSGMENNSKDALKKWQETDIFLKKGKLYEDGKILFKFPIVPAEVNLSTGNDIEKVNTIDGVLNFIKDHRLKNISWTSFFPSKGYSFAKDNQLSEWEYYEAIDQLRKSGDPIELVITGTRINLEVIISEFSITTEGNGDIGYNIEFQEFVYPEQKEEVDKKVYWKPKEISPIKPKVKYSQKDGKPIFKKEQLDYSRGQIWE